MKKLGAISLIIILGIFFIAGLDYSKDRSDRAEAVPIKTENQAKPDTPANANPPAASVPVKTEPQAKPDTEVKPEEGYYIDVSISEQKVRIYENRSLIKEWIVSTGANNSTPIGKFKIQNRGEWFYSEKYQQGAMWWVSFKDWGIYLFHSVPMDNNQNVIAEEASKLGFPSSHGCVRLEIENAKWIYDNIPQDTEVYIH